MTKPQICKKKQFVNELLQSSNKFINPEVLINIIVDFE